MFFLPLKVKYSEEDEDVEQVAEGGKDAEDVEVEHFTVHLQKVVPQILDFGHTRIPIGAEVIVDVIAIAQHVDDQAEQETDHHIVDCCEESKEVVVDSAHCLPPKDVQVPQHDDRVEIEEAKSQVKV